MIQTRRRFLTTLSAAGAAGLLRTPPAPAAGGPPETTTVRLGRPPGICAAPQAIAEELLRAEGFTDIHYIEEPPGATEPVARGNVDFDTNYASNLVRAIDAGEPITLLAGVHVGCFELFANEGIRGITDLKGKSVGIQALGSNPQALLTLMAAQVGLDPLNDLHWTTDPKVKPTSVSSRARSTRFWASRPSRRS
jgi:NitT/TauT family transport system substrate-binding protein